MLRVPRRPGTRAVARLRARGAWLLVAVLAVVLVPVSCSDDDGGEGSAAGDGTEVDGDDTSEVTRPAAGEIVDLTGQDRVEIEVRDNVFDPKAFRVDPGAEIVFVNRGRNDHNVTPSIEGAFEAIPTGALEPGESATLVLDEGGDFPMYCTLHGTPTAGQNGYIVVGD